VVGNGEVHLKRALGNPHSSAAVLKIPLHLPFLTPPILLVHFPPAASGARRVLGMPIPSFRLVGLSLLSDWSASGDGGEAGPRLIRHQHRRNAPIQAESIHGRIFRQILPHVHNLPPCAEGGAGFRLRNQSRF
jgi:hypothetical protein